MQVIVLFSELSVAMTSAVYTLKGRRVNAVLTHVLHNNTEVIDMLLKSEILGSYRRFPSF